MSKYIGFGPTNVIDCFNMFLSVNHGQNTWLWRRTFLSAGPQNEYQGLQWFSHGSVVVIILQLYLGSKKPKKKNNHE